MGSLRKFRRRYRGREAAWLRRALVKRDGGTCALCGEPFASMGDMTLDHVVPRSRGGSDEIVNLQLAHHGCNRSKGALLPEEWEALQGEPAQR